MTAPLPAPLALLEHLGLPARVAPASPAAGRLRRPPPPAYAADGQLRHLLAGALLFGRDEPMDAVHVVLRGSLKLRFHGVRDTGPLLGFAFPGDLVGLDARPFATRRIEAVALEPSLVVRLPLAQIEARAAEDPVLLGLWWKALATTLRQRIEHTELLDIRQAPLRVLGFLRQLATRQGRCQGPEGHAYLPMARSDIASHLCLALESVSRAFGRLEARGELQARGLRHVGLRCPQAAVLAPPGLRHSVAAAFGT